MCILKVKIDLKQLTLTHNLLEYLILKIKDVSLWHPGKRKSLLGKENQIGLRLLNSNVLQQNPWNNLHDTQGKERQLNFFMLLLFFFYVGELFHSYKGNQQTGLNISCSGIYQRMSFGQPRGDQEGFRKRTSGNY